MVPFLEHKIKHFSAQIQSTDFYTTVSPISLVKSAFKPIFWRHYGDGTSFCIPLAKCLLNWACRDAEMTNTVAVLVTGHPANIIEYFGIYKSIKYDKIC